tara:strand:+ start:37 stop:783 length:747 start_codon:yes stop_codon:yes gene_type:complete
MNNIQDKLNHLVEMLKDDREYLEEMSFNGKKSKLHPAETVGDIAFDNIKKFFLDNTGYDITWIRSELIDSGKKRKYKYDMDTLWGYCDFISYMILFGSSKNQAINLLKEIINEKSSIIGFNKDMSYNFMDFENFNGKKTSQGFEDILRFTNLVFAISKNNNIENTVKEKAFDDTLQIYRQIWQKLLDRLNELSDEYINSFNQYKPDNKITKLIKKYEDPLDFFIAIQSLDEEYRSHYWIFLKNLDKDI